MNREQLEHKEYNFEEGLDHTIERIKEELSTKDYVVVAVAGPGRNDTNVGKTYLSGKIAQESSALGFAVLHAREAKDLAEKHLADHMKQEQELKKTTKTIVLLNAEGSPSAPDDTIVERYKTLRNNIVATSAQESNLPVSKIDIRIFIYRPDRQITPGDTSYADIIIKNEHAVDKIQ